MHRVPVAWVAAAVSPFPACSHTLHRLRGEDCALGNGLAGSVNERLGRQSCRHR